MSRGNAVTEKQLRDEVIADMVAITDFAKDRAAECERLRIQNEKQGKEIERLLLSLIWYESTYDELSDLAKREFREVSARIGKENGYSREDTGK